MRTLSFVTLLVVTVLAVDHVTGGALSPLSPVGCIPPPPALPPDLQAEASCVASELLSGDLSIPTIAGKCTKGLLPVAMDLVSWLLSDFGFAARLGPERVNFLRADIVLRRLELAREADAGTPPRDSGAGG